MRELHIAVVGIVVLALISVLPVRRSRAQGPVSTSTSYTVTDLGTPGVTSQAFGINNCGSIAGEYASKPAFWKNQGGAVPDMVRTDIGTFGGADGSAYGLNSSGFVIGGTRATFGDQRAFLWRDNNNNGLSDAGELTDLGSLSGGVTTEAYGINDSGEVVGSTETTPNNLAQIAFIWDAIQGMRSIANGPNGFAPYTARSISNSSHIVGSGNVVVGPGNPPPVETHGFLINGSSFIDLDTLGGAVSIAEATQEILGTDYVVGYSYLSSSTATVPYHGFVWHDGQLKDLGTLEGPDSLNTNSIAYDINANGDVVGLSEIILPNSTKVRRAFLWQDDNHDGDSDEGEMKDLTTLAAGSNWTLTEAYSINDSGQIVGIGINNQADSANVHAFLMTPSTAGVLPACSAPPTVITTVSGSGVYGQPAPLSATLSSVTGPLSGKTINFSIDGNSVCGGGGQPSCPTTNASGVATLNVTGINAGDHSLTASFAGEAANLGASNKTVTLTITKGSATIALSNLTQTYGGIARFATATTNPVGLSGVTISYFQNLTPIASPTNVGSYDVLATLSNANYQAPNANGTLVIDPATATVTITIGDKIYTGVPQGGTAVVTGPGGLNQSVPIRYEGRNGTVYGPPYTEPTNVGEYLAYAEYVNPNYYGASDARFFKIDKADQTITIGTHAPTNATYNTNFTVAATSSSGLTVFYNPSSGSGCISSGTATFTMTSGTTPCTVVYEQLGNQNYKAKQVTEVVTAQKASQTLTFNPLADKTFGDLSFGLNATRGASNVPITFSATGNCQVIIPSSLAVTGAGSCTVTASEAGNSNYNPAPDVSRTFNIAKANQTITFGPLANKAFGDADFVVSATASSPLPVSFAATGGQCSMTNANTVHISGTGSCTITASQAGGNDYNAAPSVPQSFNIAKGTATLTLGNLSQSYDGNPKTVTASTTPAGLNVSIVYTQNGSPVTPVNLGNYDVSATINDTNYQGSASGTLVIHPPGAVLVLEEGSTTQLAALDSVTFARGPFRVTSFFNFSADHHTRIIFFTSSLGITDPSQLIVQAAGIPLTVEAVGPMAGVLGFDGTYVIVRLADGLPTGDVPVTVTYQGVTNSGGIITIAP